MVDIPTRRLGKARRRPRGKVDWDPPLDSRADGGGTLVGIL